MRSEEIRARLRPFSPFRITTTSGETYEVRSPDLVMVGSGSITIGVPTPANSSIYEYTVLLSLLHVVKIEPLEVPSKGNGQS